MHSQHLLQTARGDILFIMVRKALKCDSKLAHAESVGQPTCSAEPVQDGERLQQGQDCQAQSQGAAHCSRPPHILVLACDHFQVSNLLPATVEGLGASCSAAYGSCSTWQTHLSGSATQTASGAAHPGLAAASATGWPQGASAARRPATSRWPAQAAGLRWAPVQVLQPPPA